MTMTVKRLIAELEKIENKLLEVEIETYDRATIKPGIKCITNVGKKVVIRPMREYEK
jgi:hypothetical protein